MYYDGVRNEELGDVVLRNNFVHGQYQIGPFEKVFHAGEMWMGCRVVICLFLNKKLLDHF